VCGFTTKGFVNYMLYFCKRRTKRAYLAVIGVKKALTTVNRPKTPHNFQSRHKTKPHPYLSSPGSVNTQKHTSVGQAVNLNTFVC